MNREYHRWFSPSLGRDMELLIFGHAGVPMIVFPTSLGTFYEYESRGMIEAVAWQYEHGDLQAFCVSSVDGESWYNRYAHPRDRVRRHLQYDKYLVDEVLPLIRQRNGSSRLATTGCSFGGYHALNFALKHPDAVTDCISMSGAFDIHQFLDGYYDDNCYFNCPPDYLPNMADDWFLSRYRSDRRYVLATSEWDICLGENLRMDRIMNDKNIPHWLDVWSNGTKHDWPWWQQMAKKFLA